MGWLKKFGQAQPVKGQGIEGQGLKGQGINKFLVRHKKFGLAQNILGPVKEQGRNHHFLKYTNPVIIQGPR